MSLRDISQGHMRIHVEYDRPYLVAPDTDDMGKQKALRFSIDVTDHESYSVTICDLKRKCIDIISKENMYKISCNLLVNYSQA